jgi:O-antigen ligase
MRRAQRQFGRISIRAAAAVGLVAVAGVGAGAAAWARPLVALAAAVAVVVGLVLLRLWGTAALLVLSLSVIVPRYVYAVGGINVNVERVALPLLLAAMVIVLARKQTVTIRFGWSHLFLALFIGATALASLTNAPNASDSLRLTLLIAIASLPIWILPSLGLEPRAIRTAFHVFLGLGAVEALFGLLALVVFQLRGIDLGVQTDWLTHAPAPYGSLWESNIFGGFLAAVLVAAIALLLTIRRNGRRTWVLGLLVAILAAGLLASLSRGAWLGAMAGSVVVLALLGARRKGIIIGVGSAIVLTFATVQILFPASPVWSAAQQRVGTLSDLNGLQSDPTTVERLYSYDLAIHDWLQHPLIGSGAGALGQTYDTLSQQIPVWVANLELHALHDSGLIGLIGLLGAILGTMASLWAAIRRLPPQDTAKRGILVGMLGACVALTVAFQATEGTWLAYSWYVFGLGWAAASAFGAAPARSLSRQSTSPLALRRVRAESGR